MGADLILSVAWTTAPERIDFARGHACIDAIPDAHFTTETLEDLGCEGEDPVSAIPGARVALHADLDMLRNEWAGGLGRGEVILTLGPVTALVTGGTSWGESPTDLFDALDRLSLRSSPSVDAILRACGFFA